MGRPSVSRARLRSQAPAARAPVTEQPSSCLRPVYDEAEDAPGGLGPGVALFDQPPLSRDDCALTRRFGPRLESTAAAPAILRGPLTFRGAILA